MLLPLKTLLEVSTFQAFYPCRSRLPQQMTLIQCHHIHTLTWRFSGVPPSAFLIEISVQSCTLGLSHTPRIPLLSYLLHGIFPNPKLNSNSLSLLFCYLLSSSVGSERSSTTGFCTCSVLFPLFFQQYILSAVSSKAALTKEMLQLSL